MSKDWTFLKLLVSSFLLMKAIGVKTLQSGNNFRYTECLWNGTMYTSYQDMYDVRDSLVSDWPPGPYALPMPIDGCPESKMFGWEKGYIDLTWRDPHAVLTTNDLAWLDPNDVMVNGDLTWQDPNDVMLNDDYDEILYEDKSFAMKDITLAKLTETQSFVMGPFGRYRVKLNFCYKRRNNASLDIGNWTKASYGIYGDISGCPEGFIAENKSIELPKILSWTSDGYLPYFRIKRYDDSDEIVLRYCLRKGGDGGMDSEFEQLSSKEPFVLLKGNNNSTDGCYKHTKMGVIDIILYIQPFVPNSYNNSMTMVELMSVCYYYPYHWFEDSKNTLNVFKDLPLNEDFLNYTHVNINVGKVLVDSYLSMSRQTENEQHIINEFVMQYATETVYIEWAILDIGRAIPVAGLLIPDIFSMDEVSIPRCFISNGRWDFLHFSALSCNYKIYFDSYPFMSSYYIIFNRVIEGRFVVLTEDIRTVSLDERIEFNDDMKIHVLTKVDTLEFYASDNQICNSDMGMEDFGINDYDIFASSERENFPASNARPNLSGWCADSNDPSPFIMIRLEQESIINGITIMNKEDTFRTVINGTGQQRFYRIGTSYFKIAFGLTEDNLKVYSNVKVDLLFNVNEPQFFEFHRPVLAKFVKIFEIEPLYQNMKCIRFELHGCRKTAVKHLHCSETKDMKRYHGLVKIPEMPSYRIQNISIADCELACKEDNECSFIHSNWMRDCDLFKKLNIDIITSSTWHLEKGKLGFTSAKICSSDYVLSPNVIYSVMEDEARAMISYMSIVNDDSIISSIGYPFEYEYEETYKWAIIFNEDEYIQIIFTNVSLSSRDYDAGHITCDDTIIIDEENDLFARDENSLHIFTVDSIYNYKRFTVYSGVNYMTVTFRTCPYDTYIDNRGRGFSAIVRSQDTPTCSSYKVNPAGDREVNCNQPQMLVASSGYSNIRDEFIPTIWTIYRPTNTFRVEFLHFDVKCFHEFPGSSFNFEERFKDVVPFCNTDRPPSVIYTSSDFVKISFMRLEMLKHAFQLLYQTMTDITQETIDTQASSIPDIEDSSLLEAYQADKDHSDKMVAVYGVEGAELINLTQLIEITKNIEVNELAKRMKVPRLLHKACSKHFNKCYILYANAEGAWDDAGNECWIRQKRLVSIRSIDELKLVRYLLRTFKKKDQNPEIYSKAFFHNETVFYNAYIGNRRGIDKKRKIYEMWENKTPVTFSAWQRGEPLNGDCTMMTFNLANEEKTWRATDCKKYTAFYFICEQEIGNKSIDIKDRFHAIEYRGTVNTTINGHICQRWNSQYPHDHNFSKDYFFPDKSITDAANYCRSPDGRDRLFCFTTNPSVETDICYANELQEDYIPLYGNIGEKCSPITKASDEVVINNANDCKRVTPHPERPNEVFFCPDSVKKTENVEECIINFQENLIPARCQQSLRTYIGHQNTTVSGTPCLNWSTYIRQTDFHMYQFPDNDLKEAANFCRDPTASGFQWCYTTFPGKLWEICNVYYRPIVRNKTRDEESVKFICHDGGHVPEYAKCDGVVACTDLSDEISCPSMPHQLVKNRMLVPFEGHGQITNVDSGSIYQCRSLEWISYLALCDGIVDCEDASDETNCTKVNLLEDGCDKDQFKCGNGVCVHVSLVCNFIQDCSDNTDEQCVLQDCAEDEYTCLNGQCISSSHRCNAAEDCWDGSDEANCQTCSSSAVFNCDFVRCIPSRLVCDGYPDCEDKTDESSCDGNRFATCRELWEAGYRESKEYLVPAGGKYTDDIKVFCNFTSVIDNHMIATIYRNIDLTEWNEEYVFYTSFYKDDETEQPYPFDDALTFLYNNVKANCSQQVTQSCFPWLHSAADVLDPDYNHTYINCRCLNITLQLDYFVNIDSVTDCITGESIAENDTRKVLFKYTDGSYGRRIQWEDTKFANENIHLGIGPVVCVEDYIPDTTSFGCGEARNMFNLSLMCVYDTDETDTVIGCRTGSHLQNCEFHECSAGTVKCPGSYCIPLRFVCDGVEHCPNAEDEYECGCNDSEREVIIMYEDIEDVRGPDITAMARQLHSTNGVIRSLAYKTSVSTSGIPFDHKIINIVEKEIEPTQQIDRGTTCNYKLLANDFLDVIQCTKDVPCSLIFIQSSVESASISDFLFTNVTKQTRPSVYRILEGVQTDLSRRKYQHVKDIYVKNWNVFSTNVARNVLDLCKEGTLVYCPGDYKCVASQMCVGLQEVCDGIRQCIHGDDEWYCDFRCPSNCTCRGFAVKCMNEESKLNVVDLKGFPKQTRALDLRNMHMNNSFPNDVLKFPFLYLLNLSRSGIEYIERNSFSLLTNLKVLDLSHNELKYLTRGIFTGLQNLQTLILEGNDALSSLEDYTFQELKSIRLLRITRTKLQVIKSNTFADLNLNVLDLSNNDIQTIEEFGLGNLAVKDVRFEGNNVINFHKGVFTGVSLLKSMDTPAYKFCCIKPNYVLESDCLPMKDEFSSCEDLMRISALQTMLWLIGLSAFVGNILSFVYRLIFDRDRLKLGYGIFVTNLAVADFLMGVYLIIIAVADAAFRKRYIFMDDYWRNSSWCTFAGVLSTLSSEASVMFLCLITLDRFLVIRYPFGQVRLDTKKALTLTAIAWTVSLLIALFPLVLSSYFKERFYNKSGVCIALPLTRDRPPGWLYSIVVFIGLNFVTFVVIAAGQWSVYMEMNKTSGKLRKSQSRKKDLTVARNLLLVVATDFLCWCPIGIMGIMALSGYVISGDVYAWTAVFILPVNSALNPLLYTLTAIFGKKSFTPRSNEQELILGYRDVGKKYLVFHKMTTNRFCLNGPVDNSSYLTLQDHLRKFEDVGLDIIVKMIHQVAECLIVLHKHSLVLKNIDTDDIYMKTECEMLTGDIQIRHEPFLCKRLLDKKQDMYNLGLVIKKLIKSKE